MNARDDLDLPLGTVVVEPLRNQCWVFVGWFGPTSVDSYEALFVREGQLGERLRPGSPWMYHCTTTETTIRRFPELEQYRREKNDA